MKKIINITVRSLLVVCLLVCAFAMASKAKAEVASSDVNVLGAQVRTEGQAGLRFVGSYTGADEVVKYGVAVALGNADAEAVKAGAKAEVSEQDEAGQYYVTVYNIPEAAYLQEISALAYVVLADESVVWSDQVVVKNLADTSLAAANAGELAEGNLIETVVNHVDANYKKVHQDVHGNIYIDSAVYESNHKELAKAFVKDWNALFGTELDAETAFVTSSYDSPFRKSARNQSQTEASGNLVTFFNDEKMSARWGWMLDYILAELSVGGSGYSNCKYGIGLVLGTTENNGSSNWYYGFPLISYIQSIFNAKGTSSGSGQYKFESSAENMAKLSKIVDYNKSIYASSDANLVKISDSYNLPEQAPAAGYDWLGWNDGSANHKGAYAVSAENVMLVSKSSPITYTITYMDGDQVIESLSATYTVESEEITLPEYSKSGHSFEGWFDNDACEGEAITSIASGSTGNKVFYANLIASSNVSVNVTYDLAGGYYLDRGIKTTDFVGGAYDAISWGSYKNYISLGSKGRAYWYHVTLNETEVPGIYEVTGKGSSGGSAATLECDIAILYCDDHKTSIPDLFNLCNGLVEGQLVAISNIPAASTSSASINVSVYDSSVALSVFSANVTAEYLLATPLIVPAKPGYTFNGWLNSVDGQVYTEFPGYESNPGDITYTAQWVAAAE